MSKPLILELKEKALKTKILQGETTGRTGYWRVDYSSIEGEIIGSFVIGIANTNNNANVKVTPAIASSDPENNYVSSVNIDDAGNGTTYINIMVLYR